MTWGLLAGGLAGPRRQLRRVASLTRPLSWYLALVWTLLWRQEAKRSASLMLWSLAIFVVKSARREWLQSSSHRSIPSNLKPSLIRSFTVFLPNGLVPDKNLNPSLLIRLQKRPSCSFGANYWTYLLIVPPKSAATSPSEPSDKTGNLASPCSNKRTKSLFMSSLYRFSFPIFTMPHHSMSGYVGWLLENVPLPIWLHIMYVCSLSPRKPQYAPKPNKSFICIC